MKRFILYVALLIFTFSSSIPLAAKTVRIGIVTDGPMKHSGWSTQQFKNELLALTKGEFDIRFPMNKQLDGDWSVSQINSALNQLQNDPQVDMVIALGYVCGPLAAFGKTLNKPTFAPLVMDAGLLELPKKNNTSGRKNLNYISGEADFVRDLLSFRNVVDFNNLAVLVDESAFNALPGLIQQARKVANQAKVELQFVLHNKSDEELANKLGENVDAVIFTSLPRLSPDALNKLIDSLLKKRLPSYSLMGSHLVERGVLMAESPDSDWARLARRNALNMHAVLRGELTEKQPVTFKSKRRLTINLATARAIGLYPRFDVLHEAILLNEEPKPSGPLLSLSDVATEAVKLNLGLRAAGLGLDAGNTNVAEARAKLLPQINAGITYSMIDDSDITVKSGVVAERSTSAVITLSQLIYSDQVSSNVEVQKFIQANRKALFQQLELDIIHEATLSFLNLLKSQTLVTIRQDELNLTRTNLELARDRQRLGVGNPAEIYRWESELAGNRQKLLDSQARLQQSRDVVNQILHRPLKEPFIAEPATLDDPRLIVSRKELFEYVKNDRAFELMGDFMVKLGQKTSPELAGLEALIDSTKREIKRNKRAFWSPVVNFQGQLSNTIAEDRTAGLSSQGNTNWMIGVNVSLPFFEGGAKKA
ncbi:MAG: TolC family protein, partial [Gammaproteobacteria bacterium]|nr:TolC family protein [Gammaproteobacteria bacterium]